jgi:hypothetical protein
VIRSKGGIPYGNGLGRKKGFSAGDGADTATDGGMDVGLGKTLASGFCGAFAQAVKTQASATPSELCDAFMTSRHRSQPAFVSDVNWASDYADAHVGVTPSDGFWLGISGTARGL